uniref:Uncharacterized protein n=1 Tax=Glossina brevipalpis TaxID=37001 RepID=A0A1A9WRL9_9MUSC
MYLCIYRKAFSNAEEGFGRKSDRFISALCALESRTQISQLQCKRVITSEEEQGSSSCSKLSKKPKFKESAEWYTLRLPREAVADEAQELAGGNARDEEREAGGGKAGDEARFTASRNAGDEARFTASRNAGDEARFTG